jgi:hypothetical protein
MPTRNERWRLLGLADITNAPPRQLVDKIPTEQSRKNHSCEFEAFVRCREVQRLLPSIAVGSNVARVERRKIERRWDRIVVAS